MSSLPTSGRVIVDTTVGPIEIELWAKETPKATRNFLTLAMEGYYDGVIFHRVVPGFLVQTGDRTGTGTGGESFYGEPFEDEIHPRLRLPHRGIVAMANAGQKNTNDSQFFITLDRADELHGKHTVFGRVVGDTIYNVLKIGQLELDENERPVYPPKIKSIRILQNPFNDIIPRITAAEKRAQQLARENAMKEREDQSRRQGGKKNVKLLSFGGDEGAEIEEAPAPPKRKALNRPDLIDNPDALPITASSLPTPLKGKERISSETPSAKAQGTGKSTVDVTSIRAKHAQEQSAESKARQAEIEKMEADIRKLARRREGSVSDEERPAKKAKGPSHLEQELAKYAKNRAAPVRRDKEGKRRVKDESDVLAALEGFRSKLQHVQPEDSPPPDEQDAMHIDPISAAAILPPPEEEGIEVDDDIGWLAHRLRFPKDNNEEMGKAERDYEVIDPRLRGERARKEERERKKDNARNQDRGVGRAFRRR